MQSSVKFTTGASWRGIRIGHANRSGITYGDDRWQQNKSAREGPRSNGTAHRQTAATLSCSIQTIIGRHLVSDGSTGFFQSRKYRVPRSAISLSKRPRGQDSLSHFAVISSDSLSKWVAAMWTAWRLWVWGSSMKLRPQLRHEC
jgi:hypothetical protein